MNLPMGLELDELTELDAIAAESIGWTPLGEGAYLHLGPVDEQEVVITVVGVPDVAMAAMNASNIKDTHVN